MFHRLQGRIQHFKMTPDISPQTDIPLEDPTTHRSYDIILKMVLWDEPKEKIDQKFEVNKVPPALARQIYKHARAERVRTIQRHYLKRGLLGFLVVLLSSGAFFYSVLLTIDTGTQVVFVWFAPLAWGFWKFLNGVSGYLMASKKTGSVADDF